MSVLVSSETCELLGLGDGTYSESGYATIGAKELFRRVASLVINQDQPKEIPMTYNQKKVDELVSNAKVLESLRDELRSMYSTEVGLPFGMGWNSAIDFVIGEIDKRTVTLMEQIYAELVYDEVPFEED